MKHCKSQDVDPSELVVSVMGCRRDGKLGTSHKAYKTPNACRIVYNLFHTNRNVVPSVPEHRRLAAASTRSFELKLDFVDLPFPFSRTCPSPTLYDGHDDNPRGDLSRPRTTKRPVLSRRPSATGHTICSLHLGTQKIK